MHTSHLRIISWLIVFGCLFTSCKKYLDEKPDQKLVVPATVTDLQGLLDYFTRVNQFNPGAAEKSADDYYLLSQDWQSLSVEEDKRVYKWADALLIRPGVGSDWSNAYDNVYRANLVLYELDKIQRKDGDEASFNACRGHAFFIRAFSFLSVTNIWAPAYDAQTAATELGIPLRLDPDFNIPTTRATLKQSFDQVIADAISAAIYLPDKSIHVLRPSKAAAYSLLARTFLVTHQYDSSLFYASKALDLQSELLDYNRLNASATFPFAPRFSNSEIIFDSYINSGTILSMSRAKIDSTLFSFYANNDLRKSVFFRSNNNGTYAFKGSYSGSSVLFDGLAVDELYLIKSESLAWLNRVDEAMQMLNALLIKRWKTNTFIPLQAADKNEALQVIWTERRKELVMRSLRWMDIKRLNKKGQQIFLKRVINGEVFELQPNDLRFALPIPEDVIALTGIPQNPR